jgi:hypothetical protein
MLTFKEHFYTYCLVPDYTERAKYKLKTAYPIVIVKADDEYFCNTL